MNNGEWTEAGFYEKVPFRIKGDRKITILFVLIQYTQLCQGFLYITVLHAAWVFIADTHIGFFGLIQLVAFLVGNSQTLQVHRRVHIVICIAAGRFILLNSFFHIVGLHIGITQQAAFGMLEYGAFCIKIIQVFDG